jgi:DNA mismatch endonuclease (patch repair protein)
VFYSVRIAVFVDGCFWHSCPEHASYPKSNAELWEEKLARNQARDKETDRLLIDAGWLPIRVWEHEDAEAAAKRIKVAVRARRPDQKKLFS